MESSRTGELAQSSGPAERRRERQGGGGGSGGGGTSAMLGACWRQQQHGRLLSSIWRGGAAASGGIQLYLSVLGTMVTQLCVDRLGKDRHSRLLEGLAESGMGVHGATEVLAARVVPVKNHTERKV